MYRPLRCLPLLLALAVVLAGCGPTAQQPSAPTAPAPATLPQPTTAPTAPVPTTAPTVAQEKSPEYTFPRSRAEYRLDLTADGTAVVDRETGESTLVPFGEKALFAGQPKYSKDTNFIIHHVRTHAETYASFEEVATLPVDFLRTAAYWMWDDKTPQECMAERFSCPWRFPDQPDKVIVGYVDMSEFTAIGGWDASFDPAWDLDGDAIIDKGAGPLPDYVDTSVFNDAFENYVAVYWTDSWREQLKQKIDLTAVEHFDGVMLDVMTDCWAWLRVYPSMDLAELRQRYVELTAWISDYAKEQYGSAFLVTGNLDLNAYEYFPDLGAYVDGGYYQNAFFRWDGSGVVDGLGRSTSTEKFENPALDFARSQGLSVLDMDHLGTGQALPGLDFTNYDDRISEANLLLLFRWAIDSGSTPFVSPVFMATAYAVVPRFTRVLAGMPPATATGYDDWVIGSEAADVISTAGGNDLVYGGAGDDEIDGGTGQDTAFYTGPRGDYDVVREGETVVVTATRSDEGSDELTGVERLIFSDTTEAAP